MVEGEGVRAQVVAGSLFGKTSAVKTHSPLFYGDMPVSYTHLDVYKRQ